MLSFEMNDRKTVVTEFIEGLVETYPGLQFLDGFPEIKVVLRADISNGSYNKVAVISGGGSGHEPAHAGFVGEGMLTAAICGDVFASPPVDSILAGIRAVTGPKGCLLIVKNYTEDHKKFGLAAEKAKSEGYEIEMVIVGDDCALPPPRGIAGRRGLAGTILVHKVAGAAAASGLSLADVAAEARHASESVGTMGVALSVCTPPGQATLCRLGPGKMGFGLGIHGEPGAAVVDLQPMDVVVSHILKQILSTETNYVPIKRGSNVVLLINGLGATPMMELMIAARKAVPLLKLEHELAVDRVYTGSFLTSLDMAGFSISIMKADQEILKRLDAVTKAPHWPVGVDGDRPPSKIPIPVPPSPLTKNDEPPALVPDEPLDPAVAEHERFIEGRMFGSYNTSVTGTGDDELTLQHGMKQIITDNPGRSLLIVKDVSSKSFEIVDEALEISNFYPNTLNIEGYKILYSEGSWILLRRKNQLRHHNLATGYVTLLPDIQLPEEIPVAAVFMLSTRNTSECDVNFLYALMWIEDEGLNMWFGTNYGIVGWAPVKVQYRFDNTVNISGLQMYKDSGTKKMVIMAICSDLRTFAVDHNGTLLWELCKPDWKGIVLSNAFLIRVDKESIFYLGFGTEEFYYYELKPSGIGKQDRKLTKLLNGKEILVAGNTGVVSQARKLGKGLHLYHAYGGEGGSECQVIHLTARGTALCLATILKKDERVSFGWITKA